MVTTTALVTGANKGLGRETVRRLAQLGWQVFLTARDVGAGQKARVAEHPRIVMVSSAIGSFAVLDDPRYAEMVPPSIGYPVTKAALNMLTVQYARSLPDIMINAVDPGYTATDLTNHAGWQTVTEGTDAVVKLACADTDGPTGAFFDRTGGRAW